MAIFQGFLTSMRQRFRLRRPQAGREIPDSVARFAARSGTESITLNALDGELVDMLTRFAAAEGVQTSVFAKKLLLQGLGAYSASRDSRFWKAFKLMSEPRETF